jgi:pimeloyl-ACP methyl ester carboxylesterase
MRHAGVLRAFARRADKIGIVFMHGEAGAPGRVIVGLTDALEKAGYLVARPDMCWSARRSYEARFSDCLSTVDEAIVRLTNLGATEIVVGGFGLGGNAAIAYGAGHPGLLGIIAVAPGHDAGKIATLPDIPDSIVQARGLVAAGKGDDQGDFADVNIGPSGPYSAEIATTPTIYLSFLGPIRPPTFLTMSPSSGRRCFGWRRRISPAKRRDRRTSSPARQPIP